MVPAPAVPRICPHIVGTTPSVVVFGGYANL